MHIHLVNPSDTSFGIGVITPRWLYVLAAATPASTAILSSLTKHWSRFSPNSSSPATLSGIGIHTGNALRGMEVGRMARERGAWVVYGGIHATLYPEEARELGGAHVVVKGDGDVVWGQVIADLARGAARETFMTADGFRASSSCPRAGTWPRATVTCGPPYKPCAAVRNIVRSVRCGAPTARSRGSARRTS